MSNTISGTSLVDWMNSIIYMEKKKLLNLVSQEHNLPIDELMKLNTATTDVQEYVDTYNDTTKSKPKKESSSSTSSKSKKNRDIEITKESISKMKAADMKYLLKEVYNDTEGASMLAKTKEDKEIMRNRLLEHFQASTETNTQTTDTEPNTLTNSKGNIEMVDNTKDHPEKELKDEPKKKDPEKELKDEPKKEPEPKDDSKDETKEEPEKELKDDSKDETKEEPEKELKENPKKKKVIKTKKKKSSDAVNNDVDTVTTVDYNEGLDIYYNPSTKTYTISSFETDDNWLEYKLVHTNDTYVICTENKKILKKISIELTPSLGQETEDDYEAFTSNNDINEDKVGNIFINHDKILLSEKKAQSSSGYKSYYAVGKFIINNDDDNEELLEDDGDSVNVIKILNITDLN